MKKAVRFGILGLGVGASRARMVSKTKDAELGCVCDLQEEKARQVAEKFNCEWYTDYEKMLVREDIDVIGIFTSSGSHVDYAIKAIEAGKHVFTTKPMDISVKKCDKLIEAAKKADLVLAVDFNNRYLDHRRKVKLAIDSGRIGKIILADLRMKWYRAQEYYGSGYPSGWRSRRKTEGGSAANQGVHYIDLLQWFVGPVKTVYGMSASFTHKIETEDTSVAILTFKSEAWGTLVTTTASIPNLGNVIEINGDNGSIILKDKGVSLYYCKDRPDASLDEFILPEQRAKNIIEDMVFALTRGTPVAVDGVEGRESVKIFNAIYESSRMGKPVKIE